MGDSRATSGAPAPDGVANLDELIERLQALRVWSGVSYRELHRRLVRRRRSRGIPEEPVYATVYRCFQTGRRRIDIDLVAEIVAELTDDIQAAHWRQAHAQLDSGTRTTAAHANVLDSLPEDLPTFTGRQPELDLILDHARRGGGVIAIEGMAGVGKTTLAVRAAHRILDEDNRIDVVLSVNLWGHDPDRAPVEPMAVLDGFLRSLGEPGARIQSLDLSQRNARFRELIAERSSLILLDNAASEDQVRALVPALPSALVLLTSRRRVMRQRSTRHVGLEVFTPKQAIDLLRTRAGTIVDGAAETARRLVDQVGHLPLAVALVAARIEGLSGWTLQDHLDQLAERREALRLDSGVELAFLTSYEALPPSLRRTLRLLALHPGRDCDTYAAAALADTGLEAARRQLSGLVDASLLGSRVAGRFELHDLVRVFAMSRALDEDPPSARRAALTRLFDHYRWAAAVVMDVYVPEERTRRPEVADSRTLVPELGDRSAAISWLDTERPNLIAMGTYAAEHGWPRHVGDLSALMAPYLLLAAHYTDARHLHHEASRVTAGSARAVALKNLGVIRWHQGDPAEAYAATARALELARSIDDRSTEARCLTNLGNLRYNTSEFQQARNYFHQALTINEQIGDPTGASRILMNVAMLDQMVGDHGDALAHLGRALDVARSKDDRSSEMQILENLGRLHIAMGQHDEALRCAHESADIAEELGDPAAMSEALTSMGSAYAHRGELERALDLQQRGLSIAESIASAGVELYAHLELGITQRMSGDLTLAASHHHRAFEIASTINVTHSQARALDCLAEDYAAMGDTDGARAHWQDALDLYGSLHLPDADRLRGQLKDLDPSSQAETDGT